MYSQTFKLFLYCTFFISFTVHAADEKPTATNFESFQEIQTLIRDSYCPEAKHTEIQKELLEISKNDRADRATHNPEMTANDILRRRRVAEIAATACLKEGDDYFTASVIFQHGSLPEHYMQAIIYANKSMELGHPVGEAMRQVAIDRYFMSLGYKQIFGSQITAPALYKTVESEKDTQACLWPIEDNIDLVEDYGFGTQEYRLALRSTIAAKKQQIPECNFLARSSSTLLPALLDIKI
jgi:hypothetical protein